MSILLPSVALARGIGDVRQTRNVHFCHPLTLTQRCTHDCAHEVLVTADRLAVPDRMEGMLRQLLLNDLQDTSSFDTFELGLFEWYVKETDEVIDKMLAAERDYLEEQTSAELEDPNDSGIVAAAYYLKRVRYSHVVYLVSLMETFLGRECGRLSLAIGEQNIRFTLTELSGDQWTKKRKFLERYGDFSLSEEAWQDIQDLITLRNNIVHDNGAVSELSKKGRARLERYTGINLTNPDVAVESSYVAEAFASVRRLCDEVDREVHSAIQRAIRPTAVGTSG